MPDHMNDATSNPSPAPRQPLWLVVASGPIGPGAGRHPAARQLIQYRKKYRKPLISRKGIPVRCKGQRRGQCASERLSEAQARVNAQRTELTRTLYGSPKQARRAQRDFQRFVDERNELQAVTRRTA